MINDIKVQLEESMDNTIETLKRQLARVRTGRATASVLDGIVVDYYGASTPLNQVGQISTPEAKLLQIQPFDKTMIANIEKSIIGANLGVTPSNDGNLIRIPFPSLTEEKKRERVRGIKKIGEDAKIALRNDRRIQNENIKKCEKNKEISEDDSKKFQEEVQNVTDKFVAKVDDIIDLKEKELLLV